MSLHAYRGPGPPPGLPRGGPGAARGRPGTPRGHPGGHFGGNFRCFLAVRVRSHLFAQEKHEFSSKFAKFSTCAPLRRAIWTRPTRCLLNVSMLSKKRGSRLEKPRKSSPNRPKIDENRSSGPSSGDFGRENRSVGLSVCRSVGLSAPRVAPGIEPGSIGHPRGCALVSRPVSRLVGLVK